jgi:phage baseplate assembly protein W
MTRNTRSFVDLDAALTLNPRTRDVATKTDDNAVRTALRNLIHTRHYERPFRPELGCQIHNLMFELNDPLALIVAQKTIKDAINKFEPRVTLISVTAKAEDDNELQIAIVYKLRNTEEPALFTTTLTRVR